MAARCSRFGSTLLCFNLLACTANAGQGRSEAHPPSTEITLPSATSSRDAIAAHDAFKKAVNEANRAWRAGELEAVRKLYSRDAEIISVGATPEIEPATAALEALLDGESQQIITQGILHQRQAFIEWTYGTDHHPVRPMAVRGASLLSLDASGRIERETRFVDESTLSGQVGGGWRPGALTTRDRAPHPTERPLVFLREDGRNDALLQGFLEGLGDHRSVPVSNQFLPVDTDTAAGLPVPFAKAFSEPASVVSNCVSADSIAACVVARTGTFSKSLYNLKATGKRGTTRWLVVAELMGSGGIRSLTEYGSGTEFLKVFLRPDQNGFLPREELVDGAAYDLGF